jgi:C1A family cysteine protease
MPIEQHDPIALQRTIQEQGKRWRAGHTSKSRLDERQKRLHLGADHPSLADIEERGRAERHVAQATGAYPSTFDWRNVNGQNYITPVRDQGACGSCVAFGTLAAVEGVFQVQRSNPSSGIDLSEAELFYCDAAQGGYTCETGWWPDEAFKHVQAQGVVDEACFPYTAGDQACNLCSDADNRRTAINGYHLIQSTADMKDFLANVGPLTTCFNVYDDFFYYQGGIYQHTSQNLVGGHCVAVVGYDDNQRFWVCKNSWGSGWGEQGFFQIAYGDCGIDAQMWAADGIVETGWLTGALVLGAYAAAADAFTWVYLDQVGWRQVSPVSPEINQTMFAQLLASKASGRPVTVHQTAGIIDQIYAL